MPYYAGQNNTHTIPITPSGVDNPAPLADVVAVPYDPQRSGIPGGRQTRYNPFTDGPPPSRTWWREDAPLLGSLFYAMFFLGLGLGILLVWGF